MTRDLTDRVALITGAGTGIGRACAVLLARNGAKLILAGRREAPLLEAARLTELPEERLLVRSTDVSDRQDVDELVSEGLDRFGRIDILVNNAGINTPARSLADLDSDDWDRVLAVNLTGAYNCTRAVLPQMRDRRDGVIVNVSSMDGKIVADMAGVAYAASKRGLVSLSHSIVHEEAANGIRACVICPGEVDTPLIDFRAEQPSPERRAAMMRPDDIAEIVAFVAALPARVTVTEVLAVPTFG